MAEGVNKELAKLIALGVNGVIHVNNQIFVEADYIAPAASTERSYAETIDDANITAAIKSKLMWRQYSNGLSTDVDTALCKVTLTGTVDSDVARDLAGRLALKTPGVLSVDNRLEVCLSKSTLEHNAAIAATVKARDIADSWISTKVRSTFLYSSNINSHDIVVDTHDGIVSLTGKVGNVVERAFAIELAQHMRGVNEVISDRLYC
ncbi:MAG: BON domain-containing protein [Arenimonas sp.]